LIAAGKLPASLTPSANRATPKPTAERASACPIAATLQPTTARPNPLLVPIASISLPTRSRPAAYAPVNAAVIQP
jgi:hypothetical protein